MLLEAENTKMSGGRAVQGSTFSSPGFNRKILKHNTIYGKI